MILRNCILLLGLLLPLNLPFSLPSIEEDKVFGWSSTPLPGASPAEQLVTRTMRNARIAGLLPGDVLLRINGEPADSAVLARIRRDAVAGDTIELLVRRKAEHLLIRTPVDTGSASNSWYVWYRLAVALAAWIVGMALVIWRGHRPAALVLGTPLLLITPMTFPSGVPGDAVLLTVARLGWQLLASAYWFVFPALLLHFLCMHSRGPALLRSRRVWSGIYAALFGLVLAINHLLLRPLAYAGVGWERTLCVAVGLVFHVLVLLAALDLQRGSKELPAWLRWLRFAILLNAGAAILLFLLVLVLGEQSTLDFLWRLHGLILLLLPATAALFLITNEGSEWQYQRRLASSTSVLLTGLYGFAVAGSAAVVISSTGRSLGGTEWLLFAAIFLAAIIFSPVLRWAREMVDRQMFARWAELEARAHAFVDRISTELEPDRIGSRVARELPPLLEVSTVSLVLACDPDEAREVAGSSELTSLPHAELREEMATSGVGGRATTVPVYQPDGELMGVIRVGSRLDGRSFEPPEHAVLRTLAQGVAAALRNAGSYLELHRTQQELADAERIASMGALAGGLAHEIKNPLASLKMGLHLLERDGVGQRKIERLRRDIRRIDDLVSGLLRFTHEGTGESQVAVDMRSVMRDCVADMRPLAEDRGVVLREEYPAEEVIAVGSPGQLRLVISNLLVNALDAAGDGGAIEVGAAVRASQVELAVHDSGPGIPAGLQDRIFDLNFSTKPGGTGLGLALARREAERLGGRIEVESVVGQGTLLRVVLPRVI